MLRIPTAGVYVDHALANHGATGHTTTEAGYDVRHTLTNALAFTAATGFSDFIHQPQGNEPIGWSRYYFGDRRGHVCYGLGALVTL